MTVILPSLRTSCGGGSSRHAHIVRNPQLAAQKCHGKLVLSPSELPAGSNLKKDTRIRKIVGTPSAVSMPLTGAPCHIAQTSCYGGWVSAPE
jgi:hypothetical protein